MIDKKTCLQGRLYGGWRLVAPTHQPTQPTFSFHNDHSDKGETLYLKHSHMHTHIHMHTEYFCLFSIIASPLELSQSHSALTEYIHIHEFKCGEFSCLTYFWLCPRTTMHCCYVKMFQTRKCVGGWAKFAYMTYSFQAAGSWPDWVIGRKYEHCILELAHNGFT